MDACDEKGAWRRNMKKGRLIIFLMVMATLPVLNVYAKKELAVKEGTKVQVHYTLEAEGKVIVSTENKEPLEFVYGQSEMLPAFEKNILGLKNGDEKEFTLQPEEAFGAPNPNALLKVEREKFPPGEAEVGTVFAIPGPDGKPLQGIVANVTPEQVIVDFNHPLAGKALHFEVKIVKVTKL
jgi:FKBP-type peptidyl-prolyl cis-trans isomerase SlpA